MGRVTFFTVYKLALVYLKSFLSIRTIIIFQLFQSTDSHLASRDVTNDTPSLPVTHSDTPSFKASRISLTVPGWIYCEGHRERPTCMDHQLIFVYRPSYIIFSKKRTVYVDFLHYDGNESSLFGFFLEFFL